MNQKIISTNAPKALGTLQTIKNTLWRLYVDLRTPEAFKAEPLLYDFIEKTFDIFRYETDPAVIIFVRYKEDGTYDYGFDITRNAMVGSMRRFALGRKTAGDRPAYLEGSVPNLMQKTAQPIITDEQAQIQPLLKNSFPLEGWRKQYVESYIGTDNYYRWLSKNIHSFMAFPFIYKNTVIGHISISGSNKLNPTHIYHITRKYIKPLQDIYFQWFEQVNTLKQQTADLEQKHTTILNQSPDPYLELDMSGTIKWCNRAMTKIFHIKTGERLSTSEVFSKRVLDLMVKMGNRKKTMKAKMKFETAEGKIMYCEITVVPVMDLAGVGTEIAVSIKDQTSMVETNMELLRTNATLKQLNQQLLAYEAQQLRDLKRAQEIQRNQIDFPIKASKNFTYQAFLAQAGGYIGGDFMNIRNWANTKQIPILNGDAPGHGLSASISGSSLKEMSNNFLTHINKGFHPGAVMTMINENIFKRNEKIDKEQDDLEIKTFSAGINYPCMFIGVIDEDSHQIHYSNSGYPNAIVIRKDDFIVLNQANGLNLGIMYNAEYKTGQFLFEHGDKLLIFSDGFVEAFNASSNLEEVESFKSMAKRVFAKNRGAVAHAKEIIESLSPPWSDDVSFVLIEYHQDITKPYSINSESMVSPVISELKENLRQFSFDEERIAIVESLFISFKVLFQKKHSRPLEGEYYVSGEVFRITIPNRNDFRPPHDISEWQIVADGRTWCLTMMPKTLRTIFDVPKTTEKN